VLLCSELTTPVSTKLKIDRPITFIVESKGTSLDSALVTVHPSNPNPLSISAEKGEEMITDAWQVRPGHRYPIE
jgi:hypothetical protein